MKRPLVRVGIVALLLFGLAGCSATSAQLELPEKNPDQWTLPLDAYTYDTASLRDYAEALLDGACYAESGIDWPVPWQPEDRDMRGASFSAGGARLYTSELVAQYGYHTAPKDYDGFEEWGAFTREANAIAENTAGFEAISDSCITKTREIIPLPSDDTLYYVSSAANDIYTQALTTPDVVEAATKWNACMSDAGVGGYASSPDLMPGEDAAAAWGLSDVSSTAGTEEKFVAVTDVNCRLESGWTEAFYLANWDKQVAFIEANSGRLRQVANEITSEKEALLDVIAKNAPAK